MLRDRRDVRWGLIVEAARGFDKDAIVVSVRRLWVEQQRDGGCAMRICR